MEKLGIPKEISLILCWEPQSLSLCISTTESELLRINMANNKSWFYLEKAEESEIK